MFLRTKVNTQSLLLRCSMFRIIGRPKDVCETRKIQQLLPVGYMPKVRQTMSSSSQVNSCSVLTHEEAVSYVQDVLLIPDCQKQAKESPLAFLNRLIVQTKVRIPFTTVTFFSKDSGFHIPSVEQTKEYMISRQGGNCGIINGFTNEVLKHIGFDSYCFPASSFRTGGPQDNTHIAIAVKNLTKRGSLHLCDPGNRMPTFEAIPLDFDSFSAGPSGYGPKMGYFKASIGVVNLCRNVDLAYLSELKVPSLFHFYDDRFWENVFIYNINASSGYPHALDQEKNIAQCPPALEFMRSAMLIFGFVSDHLVEINRKRCLTVDENGNRNVTPISNITDLLGYTSEYFPQLSVDKVEAAAVSAGMI